MLDGCTEALEAVSEGKTIVLLRFSLINQEYPDVLTTLPSLEEFQMIQGLLSLKPTEEAFLEEILCARHVLGVSVQAWLCNDAPAGLASSVCMAWLMFGYPDSAEDIDDLMNSMRQASTYYDDFKRIIYTHSATTASDLDGVDLHKLLQQLTGVEKHLLESGIIEDRIKLEKRKKAGGPVVGGLNLQADAERMSKELSENS